MGAVKEIPRQKNQVAALAERCKLLQRRTLLLTALGRLFGRQGGKGGIQVEVRPVKDFNHGSPPFPRRCSGR